MVARKGSGLKKNVKKISRYLQSYNHSYNNLFSYLKKKVFEIRWCCETLFICDNFVEGAYNKMLVSHKF